MLETWVVIVISFAYLGLLFAIAYYADQRADAGRSVIASPYIYSLSLAVYATAWTFYGSVGRAAENGVGFLPIYIGPTLMIALWWVVMRKILRISKQNRITSLADFIASRYGKSALLGGVVTVIAVIGILPYISLQLKAVSASFTTVLQYPRSSRRGAPPRCGDTALWVALILAAFTILFGTRHLDTAEHHEGMVAAIAFESLVKLVAFVAVGAWVTWGLYNGFGDIFARAAAEPGARADAGAVRRRRRRLLELDLAHHPVDARDHVPAAPVPGDGDREQGRAAPDARRSGCSRCTCWRSTSSCCRSPSAACCISRAGSVDADTFVLTLPMSQKQELLALVVFIGGLSAATGMVIVETIALSTMVCNDLVMPVLLRMRALRLNERQRPDRPAARHPARRDRADPAARLPVLQDRRRGLRAGLDRPDLVRRGGAVRAGGARRHLLEGRHAARRAGRAGGGLRGLVLHAAAAGVRALGVAADRLPRARAVRHRAAQAARAVRRLPASTRSRTP